MFRKTLILLTCVVVAACGGGGGSNKGDLRPDPGGSSSSGGGSGSGSSSGSGSTNAAPVITLKGAASVEITAGDAFVDPGFSADDAEDGDLTSSVVRSPANIDTSTAGTVQITYNVSDEQGKAAIEKSRTLTILEPESAGLVIKLNGSRSLVIPVGEPFEDPGATAKDGEQDLSDQIQVEGSVDTSIAGSYPLTYSVANTDGETASIVRTVHVSNSDVQSDDIAASLRVLTRVEGVSPETVYFSAQDSTDVSCEDFQGGNDATACATGQWLSYHFDFDDPDSGEFATTGNSRNSQVGPAPRAIHTFTCTPESSRYENGSCTYRVGVRVQNPDGIYNDEFITVTIRSQENYYTAANTLCVSPAGNYDGCPAGAQQAARMPDAGGFSGKRVLLHAGETHGDICIGYTEKNVTIDRYGAGARPLVPLAVIGVDTGCNDKAPNTSSANAYDMLSRDSNGYINKGWAYNITLTGLRIGRATAGMSGTLQTYHDLDLNWANDATYEGSFFFGNATTFCTNNPDELDCDLVPLPYGLFLTDSVVKSNANNLPKVNIGCFNECNLINSGMAGVEAKTADEHNARFMGIWGMVVSNSWLRGNHIGGSGPKSRLTLRPASDSIQLNNKVAEDFDSGGHIRPTDSTMHWAPHFVFVIDNIFNDTIQDPGHTSAAMVANHAHFYSGIFNNSFLQDKVDTGAFQLKMGGVNVVERGTQFNSENPACGYNPIEVTDGLMDMDRVYAATKNCVAAVPNELSIPLPPAR
ncbi:DUF5011 domain-containing protein [Microbulbifer aggregans]|uniref:DUF5011 domain-containing protein n=1 Tax=Microbulbifer aggregans TaxID=1769779 RepID=UPI001CFE7D48|nr:DUF5011 domain-containing protein [Microbulbifer aggregans]